VTVNDRAALQESVGPLATVLTTVAVIGLPPPGGLTIDRTGSDEGVIPALPA
jgi:hypothetical protein